MKMAQKGTKGFVSRPLADRFWEKVDKTGSCWLWTGSSDKNGYGVICFDRNGRRRRASQVVWEFSHGKPFPSGYEACHTCDNPPCVNPAHIWAGTPKENQRDSINKGRACSPERKTKTRCVHGHAFSPENTYLHLRDGKWKRHCRTCAKIRDKLRKLARRQSAHGALKEVGIDK